MTHDYWNQYPQNFEVTPPESAGNEGQEEPAREMQATDEQSAVGKARDKAASMNAPSVDLPKSLRPECAISQQLDCAREQFASQQDRQRRQRVSNDLANLRQSFISRGNGNNPLAAILPCSGSSSDPVLRYVIACQEGLSQLASGLLDAANRTYGEAPCFYRSAFGDFLPSAFRDRADEQAYIDGANLTAADDMEVLLKRLKMKRQKVVDCGLVGLPSGISSLDDALSGFHGLTLVTGNKGVGKTSLVLSVASETLKSRADTAVLFYSLDLPKDRVLARLLCREAGIDYRTLAGAKELTAQDMQRLEGAKETLRKHWKRLRVLERDYSFEQIVDYETGGRTVKKGLSFQHLVSDCNQLLQASGAQQLLIFIDMLQKWEVPGCEDPAIDPDDYRLDVLDRLRQWSRCPACPDGFVVIATNEMRKDAGKEPTVDDLKGGGRIGSDADTVLLLSPAKKSYDLSDAPVPVKLRIEKTRDGGRRGDIHLMFDHTHYRFAEATAAPKRGKTSRRPTVNTADAFAQ